MSFEGYYQLLCTNGHEDSADVYDLNSDSFDSWRCECGEGLTWWNIVDETNGEGEPVKLVELVPAKYETCAACDHTKLVEEEKYKIPKLGGHLYPED